MAIDDYKLPKCCENCKLWNQFIDKGKLVKCEIDNEWHFILHVCDFYIERNTKTRASNGM